MGAVKAAVGDLVLTFAWIFCSSAFGLLTALIASYLGLQGLPWAPPAITTVVLFVFLFVFNLIADALGGASFNPTGNASFYAAGVGGDTLISMALRFPAQVAGAVGGAVALMELIPVQYKHMVGGPALKVDLHTGAIAEGLLTFGISFAVLYIALRGPRNAIVKTWLLAITTIIFILAGTGYTGPSMNPVNAFGWAYLGSWHNTWEQFYVYWICPFIGSVLAAWIFRLLFPPATPKQKKA